MQCDWGSVLRFGLSTLRLGHQDLISQVESPPLTVRDNAVIYHRTPALDEVYEAKREGIEQSWLVKDLPAPEPGQGGDLTIESNVLTTLTPRSNAQGGIDFFDQQGHYAVSYSQATVVDARGRTLKVSPALTKKRFIGLSPHALASRFLVGRSDPADPR